MATLTEHEFLGRVFIVWKPDGTPEYVEASRLAVAMDETGTVRHSSDVEVARLDVSEMAPAIAVFAQEVERVRALMAKREAARKAQEAADAEAAAKDFEFRRADAARGTITP